MYRFSALLGRCCSMDSFNRKNCWIPFAKFLTDNGVIARQAAEAIGCSEATVVRILSGQTLPSDKMLKQIAIMLQVGFKPYSKLSKAQKHKIAESIGTVGGGAVGFASVGLAVSSLGVVSGLSAAGVTSGLAAMGSIAGGGMVIGVTVASAIPVMIGAVGYGMGVAAHRFFTNRRLNSTDIDEEWETSIQNLLEEEAGM